MNLNLITLLRYKPKLKPKLIGSSSKAYGMIESVFFILILSLVTNNCGLPSLTEINLAPTRPDVVGYSDGTNIFIEISGRYPTSQFPKFNGFNVYFGTNNVSTNILKRVIYQNNRSELPTTLIGDKLTRTEVVFNNNFLYRLTAASDEQDLADERLSSTNDEATNTISTYNNYYFIIRPLNDFKETQSSETFNIYIPNITDNVTETLQVGETKLLTSPATEITAGGVPTAVFEITLSRTNGYYTLTPNNTNILARNHYISSRREGCYQSHHTTTTPPSNLFQTSEMIVREHYSYQFIYNDDPNNLYLFYYRIYVISVDNNTMMLCIAYEQRGRRT
ncbi:hypothetical protein COTS27_01460 [Spirochaetota bacterium]|nr:hypothetical protein COTS27_01460 [Spirochaetota bacterium]